MLLTSIYLRTSQDKLAGETIRILNAPDVKERLMSQGGEAAGPTPDQFAAYIK